MSWATRILLMAIQFGMLCPCRAQVPTSQPTGQPTAVLPAPQGAGQQIAVLPDVWYGAGAGYNPTTTHGTAWISNAKLLSESSQLYSYTTYDALRNSDGTYTTAGRTGLAMGLRQFGKHLYLLGFMTGGAAQTSAVKLSVSGGGVLLYRATSGWTAEVVVRAVNGSAGQYVIEFGTGWSSSK